MIVLELPGVVLPETPPRATFVVDQSNRNVLFGPGVDPIDALPADAVFPVEPGDLYVRVEVPADSFARPTSSKRTWQVLGNIGGQPDAMLV